MASAAPAAGRGMPLRYLERNAVMVRGSATGIAYRFTAETTVQTVDVRDADALLRSGLFVRA